jgi:hypothetical protein
VAGKVRIVKLRPPKKPVVSDRCLPPGKRKPVSC